MTKLRQWRCEMTKKEGGGNRGVDEKKLVEMDAEMEVKI